MASAKENVRVVLVPQPLPRQPTTISIPRPPSPSPLRPNKMTNGATTEPPPVSGVLKCTCFRLPSRTKKPQPLPPHPKLRSASCRTAVVAPPDVLAAPASQSQRVTFRASSASLSTWWPSPPSATANPAAPAGRSGGGVVVAPRRASASAAVTMTTSPMKAGGATSTPPSSSSHWRCRSLSRVMPHGVGERVSFSFNVSPASASSSCMSTPKIPQPQGWQQK